MHKKEEKKSKSEEKKKEMSGGEKGKKHYKKGGKKKAVEEEEDEADKSKKNDGDGEESAPTMSTLFGQDSKLVPSMKPYPGDQTSRAALIPDAKPIMQQINSSSSTIRPNESFIITETLSTQNRTDTKGKYHNQAQNSQGIAIQKLQIVGTTGRPFNDIQSSSRPQRQPQQANALSISNKSINNEVNNRSTTISPDRRVVVKQDENTYSNATSVPATTNSTLHDMINRINSHNQVTTTYNIASQKQNQNKRNVERQESISPLIRLVNSLARIDQAQQRQKLIDSNPSYSSSKQILETNSLPTLTGGDQKWLPHLMAVQADSRLKHQFVLPQNGQRQQINNIGTTNSGHDSFRRQVATLKTKHELNEQNNIGSMFGYLDLESDQRAPSRVILPHSSQSFDNSLATQIELSSLHNHQQLQQPNEYRMQQNNAQMATSSNLQDSRLPLIFSPSQHQQTTSSLFPTTAQAYLGGGKFDQQQQHQHQHQQQSINTESAGQQQPMSVLNNLVDQSLIDYDLPPVLNSHITYSEWPTQNYF